MTIDTQADRPEEQDSGTASVLTSGQLGDETSLRDLLQIVAARGDVQNGVIRILSKEVRGHIGVEGGTTITGAHVTSTREYGRPALKQLLSATRGMYAYLSLPVQQVELRQALKLNIDDVLNWRPPFSDGNSVPTLADAAIAMTTDLGGNVSEQLSLFSDADSQLVRDTEAEFATYMAWGGEVPVLSTNLASLNNLLAPKKSEQIPSVERIPVMEPGPNQPQECPMPPAPPTPAFQPSQLDAIPTPKNTGAQPFLIKKLADAAARITGQHLTNKARLEMAVQNAVRQTTAEQPTVETPAAAAPAGKPTGPQVKITSEADIRSTSQRLKAAAAMGVDLTTASHRLKAAGEVDPMKAAANQRMRAMETEFDADDYIPPIQEVKRVNKDAIIGGIAFVVLAYIFGRECTNALTYKNSLESGMASLKAGKTDLAVIDLSTSIKANPAEERTYYYRALAEVRHGNPDAAMADFDKAISMNPKNLQVYIARATLNNRLKQFDEAIEDADKALAIDPTFTDAYRVRGIAYNHSGRYSEAISDSMLFLKRHAEKDKYRADALANRAYAFFQKKEFDAAISDYSEAIACDPHNGSLYASRAVAYRQVHDWKKGVDDCNIAIDLLPAAGVVYKIRGACYAGLGMSEDSLRDLDQLIKFHPTVENHRMRGDARLLVHDYEGAVQDYEYVLGAKPHDQDVKVKYEKARLGLQATAKVTSAVDDAVKTTKKSEPVNTKLPEPELVKHGYDLMRSGDAEEAMQYLVAAVKKDPNDASARRYLAYAMVEAGLNDDAAHEFTALAKLQTLPSADQIMWAKALVAANRAAEAEALYTKLLSSEPTNDKIRIELIELYLKNGGNIQASALAEEGGKKSPAMLQTYNELFKRAHEKPAAPAQ